MNPARVWLSLTCIFFLSATSALAQNAAGEILTIDPADMQKAWTGDLAAEKIGQETVTYVSNIYKYYIAYRLVMDSQASRKEAIEKVKGGAK